MAISLFQTVIARLHRRGGNLGYSGAVIAKAEGLWQSHDGNHYTNHKLVIIRIHTHIVIARTRLHSSLRGFKKAVAISLWDIIILLVNFFFSVFILVVSSEFFFFLWINRLLVVCGLLRRFTPRNDKGGKWRLWIASLCSQWQKHSCHC